VTHELGGANYVLWGGREGYETLRTIEPDPAAVGRYREGHARYRALYPALKETRE
jgi:xylose isomerase